MDVVFETDTAPDTTAPTVTGRLPAPDADGVPAAANVERELQRADEPGERRPEHVPAARPERRARPGRGVVRRRVAHGDARPAEPARRLHALHGHRQGRRRGRQGPLGQPAGGRRDVVVHHRRRAAAGPGRGPRRPDPRDRQGVEPVHPLLRRDPARRGPELLHGARHRERHPGQPRRLRRGDPRRHRAHRRAGHDAQRLGDRRAATSSPCGRTSSSRACSGSPTPGATLSNAYMRVDATQAARYRHRLPDHAVPRHGRPLRRSTAPPASPTSTRPRRPRPPRRRSRLRSVGSNGGRAAAFTYDLARSVVYTRQGNPAWAGQERDGSGADPLRRPVLRRRELRPAGRTGSTSARWRSRRPTSSSACWPTCSG